MYCMDIIGNGRITLALLKAIFEMNLDSKFKRITVWCRERKVLAGNNKVVTKGDNINQEIFEIYIMQKANGKKLAEVEQKVQFKTFGSLDDLMPLKVSGKKNILFLAAKYNLDELVYLDKGKKEKINPDYPCHFELLLARMKFLLRDTIINEQRGHNLREKILHSLKHILMERQKVHMVINELCKRSSVGYTRLYNMEHSSIGVKWLSQALRNYHGIIFNMINEVDTTNYILHKYSGINPEKIISPCENDSIRARYFLRKNLKFNGIGVNNIFLHYLGPHNHTGFIPPDIIKVDGKRLSEIMEKKSLVLLIERVTQKVNDFGEAVFLHKGSSDEDTVAGICSVLSSLFTESKQMIVRASCYDKYSQLYTGLPGHFQGGLFSSLQEVLSGLSQESREKLFQANKEQNIINQRIMSAIS